METQYYFRRVLEINKALGGALFYQYSEIKDDFTLNQDDIIAQFNHIRQDISARAQKRGAEAVRMDFDLNKRLDTIDRMLKKMRGQIAQMRQAGRKSQQELIQQRTKIYDSLMNQFKELRNLLMSAQEQHKSDKRIETITDAKAITLLDKVNPTNPTSRRNIGNSQITEQQKQALQRWRQNDKIMDGKIMQVTDGLDSWLQKAKAAGQLINQTTDKITSLTKEVDQTNVKLNDSNMKLKGLLQKYRAPHKFCIDVVLVIILITLIVFIVKFAKK